MYRKFTITDEGESRIEFKCHPEHDTHNYKDYITVGRDEIGLTLKTRQLMMIMVELMNKFMGGNTINKVEVEEIEE